MPMTAAVTTDEPPIIKVRNVVKEYRLGALEGLRTLGRRMLGRAVPERQRFRAMDDVSFSVKRGEVVGIIGHNGAGKSTLLKLLCNITKPTSGSVSVRGRIAPLIEVGAGLVGDMTGRENIYLNGSILGLSRSEIECKIDGIIAFAELEQFIDTPIKRYSSGMQAKLGFAIATAVDSSILIVDEVLSVGDLAFQKKCYDRIERLIRRENKTVFIVSHNLRQIERICSRVILLDKGKILLDGNPADACEALYAIMAKRITAHIEPVTRVETSGEITVRAIEILNSAGDAVESIDIGAPLTIAVTFEATQPILKPSIVIGTHTTDLIYINAGYTGGLLDRPDIAPGIQSIQFSVPFYPLAPGVYCVRFSVFDENHRPIYIGEGLKMFEVAQDGNETKRPGSRLIEIDGTWKFCTNERTLQDENIYD